MRYHFDAIIKPAEYTCCQFEHFYGKANNLNIVMCSLTTILYVNDMSANNVY